MTKRVRAKFIVKDGPPPWIGLEPLQGDSLDMFANKKYIGFDLRPGTSPDEAQDIAQLLNDNLTHVSET